MWIQGKSIVELALVLVPAVPKRFLKQRTVQEALSSGGIWANDVRDDLSDNAFLKFLCIWVAVWFRRFSLCRG
jgi:hypothetical protein